MSLINPADTVEKQNEKLLVIAQSLMRRVEQKSEESGLAYRQFERAALLESQVRERTRDLERTLDLLQDSNARLEVARAETETARSNLAEAIETIDEGFALFDTDDRLVLFNSRFCQDLLDIVPGLSAGLPFEDYVSLVSESRFLSLPKNQTPEDWARRRLDHHRDPHVVFNVSLLRDRWLQVSEHRTSGGGTVILQTDVSDIIQLERQERDKLRDEQARILQATLDHLNQGVCIFDRNRTLVGWNSKMDGFLALSKPRVTLGMNFSYLINRLRDQLVFTDKVDAERLRSWANRANGRPPIAFEIRREDGRIYSVFAQEMPDHGFVISFTDVTAEREAARALFEMNEQLERRVRDRTQELGVALAEAERANASKSRFVAAASHDLLQPLSAAKLFVSSLADKVTSSDAQDVIGKTETALNGAQQIIEALLDISKLDAGKAVFKVQTIRISDILAPLRDELAATAAAKGIALDILDSSLTVRSDPAYLRRIVQNLLSNAMRYTDKGRVLLGVRRSGTSARIEVWDTGCGIAEADQEQIFQEFSRLNPDPADGGLGLGLAIVERACKGLGHELGLWSKPGSGSCFSLNVPIDTAALPHDAKRAGSEDTTPQDLNGLLVLLVENDPAFAGALSLVVEDMGGEVIHAHTADEAMTLMHAIQLIPDAFLFDYQLDKGNTGTALYQEITKTYGPISAAIVSADRTRELRQTCKTLGLPLMSKPVDRDRLWGHLSDRARELTSSAS
ncbi:PAS-domain containing protein [uncultured Roseobacter sp.]|uniref:hybrid sensor histidine kinase/response regulator n=1 Tax=uncultured Roseobacter sp. TaxID=114847 RepID=UPI0026085D5C|nr:PAS-domain containing protein [uncultured Roseobacter sp.]